MKSLAIVSSWNEECGIAAYSAALKPEFEKYYDVEVMKLDTEILNSSNSNHVEMGDRSIADIAERVKKKDCVNIQFECGLFGCNAKQIYERFRKIAENSRNLIVTFHSINLEGSNKSIKRLLKGNPIENFLNMRRENSWSSFYHRMFNLLNKLSRKKNVWVVVHTPRDARLIREIAGFRNVSDYPLTLLNKEQREIRRTPAEHEEFLEKYHLAENEKTIGLFGFTSEYKGHDIAVNALEYLPDNYKLMIFGAQHPRGIVPFRRVDGYLQSILDRIAFYDDKFVKAKLKRRKVYERVEFFGAVSDEELIEAMRNVDIVALPYIEVGQMGSGIATNALECKAKIIASNTKCFAELRKYYPNCFAQFDIGNSLELANKIMHFKDIYTGNIEKALLTYNLENNIKHYVELFERKKNE